MPDDTTNHPGVIRIERELSWSPAGWEHVLVIVTSLQVDPTDPTYDATALHAMTEAVAAALRAKRQGFNRIVVRTERAAP
ncbi:MAG: hypothetical protein QNJ84_01930 [Alphaproteobacteria bacterium]|nr:hypothetical protein [Alphaproteobacteria bacterium]